MLDIRLALSSTKSHRLESTGRIVNYQMAVVIIHCMISILICSSYVVIVLDLDSFAMHHILVFERHMVPPLS